MWPFKAKKSKADLAVEWLPRAIDVATHKWLDFESQPFAQHFSLVEKIAVFTRSLEEGLTQWAAFKDPPPGLIALIAAKGVERSGTHTRADIERALCVRLPDDG